jgi:diguanylate cyclase (GGDEF)-like protein
MVSEQEGFQEELQRALDAKWWVLHFPESLEIRYRQHARNVAIKAYRINAYITIILFALFGVAIYPSLPQSSRPIWLILLFMCMAVMVIRRIILSMRRFDRWFDWHMPVGSGAIAAFLIVMSNSGATGDALFLSYVGVCYSIFLIYCFVGLRVPLALFAGWAGGAVGIGVTYALGFHVHWALFNGTYTTASALGMVIAYMLERQARLNFLQARSLSYLSLHDSLTKLPNRALFEDRLTHTLDEAHREGYDFALMFMDLDGFKQVNDAYGHHIGDMLLRDVAQRIRSHIRSQDTFARLGGDEFVLLVKSPHPEGVAILADKLLDVLRQPFQIEDHTIRITSSIGIALYPDNGKTRHDLLTQADAAMYHGKETGRNMYCFFDASMNIHAHEHMEMLQDLRMALERNELVVYYQVKVDTVSLAPIGAEALLRWHHPIHGLIAPDRFIPLAEKTGLIIPIGAWVLDQACRQMRQWLDMGHQDWTMAVNLSALQFAHSELIQTVSNTLLRYDLASRYLTLEITESTAMHDVDASALILKCLYQMGVRMAIDDFGTGYSSLLYLKRLPASELKIDRGFIANIEIQSEDQEIVSAIIALGHVLGLKIVAEGVETPLQRDFLAARGCDSLQGYLFGKPMLPQQFIAALQAAETQSVCS